MDSGKIASVDRPIWKKQTMKSLNNKFNDSKTQTKISDNLRNYVEHGVIHHQKSKSKYMKRKSEDSEEECCFEDRHNDFIHRHKSDKDASSVDKSRWNLSVREKLKKRSTKVRQILLTSRDSIDKLDNSNFDSNKHYQSHEQEEELKEQCSLEQINAPYGDQLTKDIQMRKVENKEIKDNESSKNSKAKQKEIGTSKHENSSKYSKSSKNDNLQRNIVDELKKRK